MQDQLELDRSIDIAPKLFDRAIATLTQQDDQLIECCLTCEIPLDLYQTIEKHEYFNLKPELRNQPIAFSAETDITLKITLHPDRHPDLTNHTTSPESTVQYLKYLSQLQPDHPLLNWENWFLLSAEQGDRGYTTLWATLNPSKLAAGQIPEAELTDSLSQFFVNLAGAEFTKAAEQFGQTLLDDVTNLFKSDPVQRSGRSGQSLTNTMIAFFTQEDWTFTKIQGQPVLQMGYQGKNGKWICYARANEDPAQFIFYSIYPTTVPEDRKIAIAEFITRANSGIVVGNFEFNFTTGEILYKTSLDVEGVREACAEHNRLTSALIQRLVYPNLATLDHYLPGIVAVLEAQAEPEAAIAHVEDHSTEVNPTTVS